jgi:predicted RNA-binding Zn-ribbon protein involved in translation (DUF1610 family)
MSTMDKIHKLLSEGKSPKEIIGMGFAHSTVYAVAKKVKGKIAGKKFEVDLDIYELIDQMTQWMALLIIDAGFADETKPVPCLYCAAKGEENFMMKKKKDRFECPRCGESLLQANQLSQLSTICLVRERIKRGEKLSQ